MTKLNVFSERGRQMIKDLACGMHGQSARLNSILDSFTKNPNEDELAILIEDLRSYLAERLPKASISEARLFALRASCAQGKEDLGMRVSVKIRAYQQRQAQLASGENQGSSSDPAASPDDGEHKEGPGNPSPRKIKSDNDPR